MLKESLLWARHLLTNVHKSDGCGRWCSVHFTGSAEEAQRGVAGQTPTPSVVNTTSGSVRDLWTPLNYSTLLPLFTFLKNNNIINSLFKSSYNSSVIIAVTPGVPVR